MEERKEGRSDFCQLSSWMGGLRRPRCCLRGRASPDLLVRPCWCASGLGRADLKPCPASPPVAGRDDVMAANRQISTSKPSSSDLVDMVRGPHGGGRGSSNLVEALCGGCASSSRCERGGLTRCGENHVLHARMHARIEVEAHLGQLACAPRSMCQRCAWRCVVVVGVVGGCVRGVWVCSAGWERAWARRWS